MSFRFVSTRRVIENSKKIAKKSKNYKILLWLHFKQKQVGKGREREKIKIVVPFRTHPTRNRKFEKNSEKIKKIKKYHYGLISSQNRLEKAEKDRK